MLLLFSSLTADLRELWITRSIKERWVLFFTVLMRFGFYFYILFLPLGIAPRQIGGLMALAGLLGYYALDYEHSNLKRLGQIRWIYFVFLAYLLFKAFHNINMENGWYGFKTNIHGGFSLFFVGLECVRSRRDLGLLVSLFCVASLYEGLDGIYQWIVGQDLLRGTKIQYGRLTGTMKTPRVGNYLAITIPICWGAWWILPQRWSKTVRALAVSALLFPPFFLLIGSQTRSGYVGVFVALVALYILRKGLSWKLFLAGSAVILWSLFWGFQRTSWEVLSRDLRLAELWPLALKVFQSAPWFGVGLDSFNPGVHKIGLKFVLHPQWVQHPHNIYLQFLCEMGVIGLGLLLIFFGTYLLWSWRRIRLGLTQNGSHNNSWALLACFWVSFLGYTATAFSAHDFFRSWWLGMAFSVLGILMGGCATLWQNNLDQGSVPLDTLPRHGLT